MFPFYSVKEFDKSSDWHYLVGKPFYLLKRQSLLLQKNFLSKTRELKNDINTYKADII